MIEPTTFETAALASRGYALVELVQTENRGWVAVAVAQRPCAIETCGNAGPSTTSVYGRTARSAIRNLVDIVLRP